MLNTLAPGAVGAGVSWLIHDAEARTRLDAEVIPGLASLPAQDREQVCRQCVRAGLRDKVSKLTLVALAPLVGLGAAVFGTIGAGIGGGVGGLIFGIVAAVRVRSCLLATVAARLRDNERATS